MPHSTNVDLKSCCSVAAELQPSGVGVSERSGSDPIEVKSGEWLRPIHARFGPCYSYLTRDGEEVIPELVLCGPWEAGTATKNLP